MDAAQDDVRYIHAFISQDSPRAANAIVRRLRAASRRLGRYPESGRIIAEYGDPQYRETVVGRYRLVYRYLRQQNLVRVLAVIDGSRLLPPIREAE